ncbi:MAG: hypothetical protein MHMPM18_001504 [Marteilia pararefringens]
MKLLLSVILFSLSIEGLSWNRSCLYDELLAPSRPWSSEDLYLSRRRSLDRTGSSSRWNRRSGFVESRKRSLEGIGSSSRWNRSLGLPASRRRSLESTGYYRSWDRGLTPPAKRSLEKLRSFYGVNTGLSRSSRRRCLEGFGSSSSWDKGLSISARRSLGRLRSFYGLDASPSPSVRRRSLGGIGSASRWNRRIGFAASRRASLEGFGSTYGLDRGLGVDAKSLYPRNYQPYENNFLNETNLDQLRTSEKHI